jgi:hypothetical protein
MAENEEGTGSGETNSGSTGTNVQEAVKLVGDLAKSVKNAVVAGSVIMTASEEERTALQGFVNRCAAQASAVDAIREAQKATRPPSRQRTSTKSASKKGATK